MTLTLKAKTWAELTDVQRRGVMRQFPTLPISDLEKHRFIGYPRSAGGWHWVMLEADDE